MIEKNMLQIYPVSDLRTNLTEISKIAQQSNQPIYFTKNGRPTLVLMGVDAYNNHFEEEVYLKLKEAENKEKQPSQYFSQEEVIAEMKNLINQIEESALKKKNCQKNIEY